MYLLVDSENIAAQKLYKKLGEFEDTKRTFILLI